MISKKGREVPYLDFSAPMLKQHGEIAKDTEAYVAFPMTSVTNN